MEIRRYDVVWAMFIDKLHQQGCVSWLMQVCVWIIMLAAIHFHYLATKLQCRNKVIFLRHQACLSWSTILGAYSSYWSSSEVANQPNWSHTHNPVEVNPHHLHSTPPSSHPSQHTFNGNLLIMANTSANESLPWISSTQASLKSPKTSPWSLNREIIAPGRGSVGDTHVYARLVLPLITSLIRWPDSPRSFSQAVICDATTEASTPCPNRARWERRGRTLLAFWSRKRCEATSRCMFVFQTTSRVNLKGEPAWSERKEKRWWMGLEAFWLCQRPLRLSKRQKKTLCLFEAHFKVRSGSLPWPWTWGSMVSEGLTLELMHNERFPVKMVSTNNADFFFYRGTGLCWRDLMEIE